MSAKLHRCVMASTGLSPPSEPRSRSTPNRDSEPDDPDLAMVPAAMSTVRTSTPQRAAQTRPSSPPSGPIVSEPTSSEASPAIQFPSQGSQLPDPMTNVPAAAFIAGAAVQQAHRASDLAAQAANHALHQQQAADQARQEAGWIRERAVREVSDVRVQAAQLASQAQQAVQTAQQSEAQARQLIEQTRQEDRLLMPLNRTLSKRVNALFKRLNRQSRKGNKPLPVKSIPFVDCPRKIL